MPRQLTPTQLSLYKWTISQSIFQLTAVSGHVIHLSARPVLYGSHLLAISPSLCFDGKKTTDMAGSDDSGEERPPFGEYQLELYKNGVLLGEPPVVTTNPSGLEAQARKAMEPGPFNYIYGGAGEASTMDANRLAFRQWKIIPRVLRPTVPRDLNVELFGKKYRECLPETCG